MEEKDEARLKADVDEIMKRIETILENIKTFDPKLAKKAEKESD
jgi:hypothetical protein